MSNPKKRAADDGSSAPRKGKKRKANMDKDDSLDSELGINTTFARMDNQLLADHLLQKLTRFGADLSPVEVADMTISANVIKDTTSWQEPRTTEKLPEFLEEFTEEPERLSRASKKHGKPHTLIVAGAGLRAANLVRAVRKFQSKENAVAKLFAKHIKVEEQVKFLSGHRTGIGVGTPARLTDLLENGALGLENLQRVVVDASHIDQKKRGVLDMKDTLMPLAKLLTRPELKDRYGDEKKPVDLIFY
ncbi:u3-containing 90S pre-ribosomal complex subunit domain-containing protein [Sarocladium implicatum]|nr:u3-containing 90S pre-ribosomal complex subunit domain-containing protein [Sarocladium implicatum]